MSERLASKPGERIQATFEPRVTSKAFTCCLTTDSRDPKPIFTTLARPLLPEVLTRYSVSG